jgi:hypothetical protein
VFSAVLKVEVESSAGLLVNEVDGGCNVSIGRIPIFSSLETPTMVFVSSQTIPSSLVTTPCIFSFCAQSSHDSHSPSSRIS